MKCFDKINENVGVNRAPVRIRHSGRSGDSGRYKKATGALLLRGTGTSLLGTGTSICGTSTTAFVNAPSHCSTTRGFTTAASINRNDLHSFSGHEHLTKFEKPSQAPKT